MNADDFKTLFLTYRGRISRRDFWIATLLLIVAEIILNVIAGLSSNTFVAMLMAIPGILFLVISWFIWIKRIHDHGKSGWFSLLLLIPLLNILIWFIWLGCMRGTEGSNDYGDDPLKN